jgi:GNAT superfamily N-acetyltransferase
MGFLRDKCLIFPLNNETLTHCHPFSCGDNDLDDFFSCDADNYERQLLGKSYCFRLEDDMSEVICAFTLSNSSIDARNLPNSRRKKLTENIPHEKSLSSYPATLIGRLGVSCEYGGRGIGTELMEFIKQWLLEPSAKAACRYLTVDAYNHDQTLKFYETNGFKLLFSSEQQEKEYIGLPPERELKTRLMYFDLIFIDV